MLVLVYIVVIFILIYLTIPAKLQLFDEGSVVGFMDFMFFGDIEITAGKWDHRGGDLRDKLDKRLSPQRRISPGRNTRSRHTFHGSSPSRSIEKNSDRKRRKKQHFDGQSDLSRSLKSSDGAEDRLIEAESEIDLLDQQKSQLKTLVEEKVEEADILTSRVLELDFQLSKEKEEYRRSQVRLQRLGDHLGSDTTINGGNEEDSSINIVSDGEAPGYHTVCPPNEVHNNHSLARKSYILGIELRLKRFNCSDILCRISQEYCDANLTHGGGYHVETTRLGKLSQLNACKEVEMVESGNDGHQPTTNGSKQKRGHSVSASMPSADKPKGSGLGLSAPSTSMAAHAIDELVEIEVEENIEVVETTSVEIDKGATTYGVRRYKGKDENVDVEGLEEEMIDVDIVESIILAAKDFIFQCGLSITQRLDHVIVLGYNQTRILSLFFFL
ncbi:hypothetical protein GH714_034209 [Hevea brasiliensis]|uniref:Uncharacterized protein n=1 Tax=Hevea brasiliensis TaxID=3981 RepID=A0A6A6K9C5_HEVBR|nr:hypothetical protein GH714_034209 [Hevea brasiliensis]